MVEILQLQYKKSNYYGSQEKKKNENNPKPQFVQTSKKKPKVYTATFNK